ncbi:MAG: NAD(P)H-dependent oxidoreductase [Candidatus Omnitrophota bacterium]
MKTHRILWYIFHPNFAQSRGNRIIYETVKGMEGVTFRLMDAVYPDGAIDVKKEQELLRAHDLIVFQHPFYWYSSPALFKQWQDSVLEYGFAYPPKEGKALHGKHWLSVTTTGGPQWAYASGGFNNFTMSELLRPFQQTAYLCGMRWMAPRVLHGVLPGDHEGVKAATDEQVRAFAKELKSFLEKYDLNERHSLEPVVSRHSL